MSYNAFGVGITLPATEQLKIGWETGSADAFINLALSVKTKADQSFFLIDTKTVVQGGINVTSVSVPSESLLIAQKDNNQNQTADWLNNCGPNRGFSCGQQKYVLLNTSAWSADQRTVFGVSSLALHIGNLYWEDAETSGDFFQVLFDSMGGSVVSSQLVIPDELLDEPQAPLKELFLFDGWFLEPNYQTEWDFATDVVTESLVLYAKWNFDENFLDYATTSTLGVVQLSDAETFDQLQESNLVMTEETTKSVLEDVFNELEDVLDEFEEELS